VILVENDFHSNVSFALMAKAYHAMVGTFASHDEVLSLWWSDLLQRIVWQKPNQLHCVDKEKDVGVVKVC